MHGSHNISHASQRRGAVFGVAAAALFGISTPAAKLLLPECNPIALASLLYLGAAAALFGAEFARRSRGTPTAEAPLKASDLPLLFGMIVSGGLLGPVLMLFGLARLSAVAASLLLNLEAPFTIVIAVLAFGEHLARRESVAAVLIVGGAVALSGGFEHVSAEVIGALAIAGACLCWAIDNNLTQRLSLRDPVAIVRLKALGTGAGNLLIALALGAQFPSRPAPFCGALLLGAVSYGMSILLDTYALRLIGAAREAAYFATAPFFGALTAVFVLGEGFGWLDLIAAALLATGVGLLVAERHEHEHVHEVLTHDHLHFHDEHHRHEHPDTVAAEAHAHAHAHRPLRHAHRHASDVHHRHPHQ